MDLEREDTALNKIILLNSSLKKEETTTSQMMKTLHQMKLLLGEMVFNLHKLHLRVNDSLEKKMDTDVDKDYYYMSMYESLLDSIKSLISAHENKFLLMKDGDDIDLDVSEQIPSDIDDISIGKDESQQFLDDLRSIGKDPVLFSPENFIKDLKLMTDPRYKDTQFQLRDNHLNNKEKADIRELQETVYNEEEGDQHNIVHISDLKLPKSQQEVSVSNNSVNDLLNKKHIVLLHNNNNRITDSLNDTWSAVKGQDMLNTKFTKINCDKEPEIGHNLGYNGGINLLKIQNDKVLKYDDVMDTDKMISFINDHSVHQSLQEPLSKSGLVVDDVDTLSTIDSTDVLSSDEKVLTFYHNPKCIHCVNFYPVWAELGRHLMNRSIRLEKVNCLEEIEKCRSNGIKATPTIILTNSQNDMSVMFDNDRTLNNLLEFIDRNSSDESEMQEDLYEERDGDDRNSMFKQMASMDDIHYGKEHDDHQFEDLHQLVDMQESSYDETYLICYYSSWCGYSREFLPQWHKLKSMLPGINCIEIKVDDKSDWAKYKLNSVPTVDLFKNNKLYRYGSDDRSIPNLIKFTENPESGLVGEQLGGSNSKIMLFYADWCGHCQNFKPIWNSLMKKVNIEFEEYNADVHTEEIKKYGIEGFPTIILQSGDDLHKFEEDRTVENLKTFINKNM